MQTIATNLAQTSHRTFALPPEGWAYYQEWQNVLFLHWKVPFKELRKVVPGQLIIDTYEGDAYISLVAFDMHHIRPRYLPSVSFISNFPELNIRTYVTVGGKPGIYFLSMEAGKQISASIAKLISGLPYEKAEMQLKKGSYTSLNHKMGFSFGAEFTVDDKLQQKSQLDEWLTERYCVFLPLNKGIYEYDVHHLPWQIRAVNIRGLNVKYNFGTIDLSAHAPYLAGYSEGVQVLAWRRRKF